MSDYYIKMSELIELAKDRVVLDPALNCGDESFVKGAKWGAETLMTIADAKLQHYDFDNLIMNAHKCPYCGKEMKPFVDEKGGAPLLVGLKCDCCGSIGPKIMFDNSMIDEKKFMEEYAEWIEGL